MYSSPEHDVACSTIFLSKTVRKHALICELSPQQLEYPTEYFGSGALILKHNQTVILILPTSTNTARASRFHQQHLGTGANGPRCPSGAVSTRARGVVSGPQGGRCLCPDECPEISTSCSCKRLGCRKCRINLISLNLSEQEVSVRMVLCATNSGGALLQIRIPSDV